MVSLLKQTSLYYQQILLHICHILADLRESLYYMQAMDYIDVSTTGILSPCVLPVEDLREMLMHIESKLPSTMHLPVSLDDICTSIDTCALTF